MPPKKRPCLTRRKQSRVVVPQPQESAQEEAPCTVRQADERDLRRQEALAANYQQRKAAETEQARLARLNAQRLRDEQRLSQETPEQRAQRLDDKARRTLRGKRLETAEERQARLAADSGRKAAVLTTETPEQRGERLDNMMAQMRDTREARAIRRRLATDPVEGSPAPVLSDHAESEAIEEEAMEVQELQPDPVPVPCPALPVVLAPTGMVRTYLAAFALDVRTVPIFHCGAMSVVCEFCQAKHFVGEVPQDKVFRMCCHKGKVLLPPLTPLPPLFHQLYTSDPRDKDPRATNFRDNIRAFNSSLSFASVGANLDRLPGRGTFCFRLHGAIMHRVGNISRQTEHPKYAHLYFLDAQQARQHRADRRENDKCDISLMADLDAVVRRVNPFAVGLKTLGDWEQEQRAVAEATGQPVREFHLRILEDRRGTHNAPTANEIAVVFQSDEDGFPPLARSIRINTRDGYFQQLDVLSPNVDAMSYVLLFPHGDPGWQIDMPHTDAALRPAGARNKITMLQFYSHRFQVRDGQFSPVLHAGKLTQQYIVDAYTKVEGNRLNYIKTHQKELRAESYVGLMDHINNRATRDGVDVGRMVILPSSFIGSQRHMMQLYQDAMAIVTKFGKPDFFLTFTCNPKWQEIQDNLEPYDRAEHRPDLTARVFRLKLNELMYDITRRHVLGVPVAHFHVIEFQKRGLPHAHILIILREEDKLRTPEQIDAVICAELPDIDANPRLHEVVVSNMLHGPCGVRNRSAPCMKDGKCEKKFPKDFCEVTVVNNKGYTEYRRRDNGATHLQRGFAVDNRCVVPYNPYFAMKYGSHINIEHCGSAKSVKYLCKYVYKGHDCARVELVQSTLAPVDGGPVGGGGATRELHWDEALDFLSARYVSSPEGMWRLLEYKMHDKSHTIIRLACHLDGEQILHFHAGEEQAAADRAEMKKSTLLAWFELNRKSDAARHLKYWEVPYHYTFTRASATWTLRRRRMPNIISRMYAVSPRDYERYFLRLLLLHVSGAQSFEDVRTFEGTVYPTFKEAAIARQLLADDVEWERCLREAAELRMPRELRNLFAMICAFNSPTSPANLWDLFYADFAEDFSREYDEATTLSYTLGAVRDCLILYNIRLSDIGLPEPQTLAPPAAAEQFDVVVEREEGEANVALLNPEQRAAFNTIMAAVDSDTVRERCFFLHGPGGSGKTFLYNTIVSVLRGRGKRVIAVAWTGIAANLLKGGRTVHSRFRLPVPVVENSTSGVKAQTRDGSEIKEAKLIIWDEVTITPSLAARTVDRCAQDLANNSLPFGGKVVILGGDFAQCLPVLRRGHRTSIVEQCISRSALWRHVKTLRLTANMRASAGEVEFAEWLLKVGRGDRLNDAGLPDEYLAVPDMCVVDNVVDAVFGKTISREQALAMHGHAVLCPRNTDAMAVNDKIIDRLEGELKVYLSADTVVAEGDDAQDLINDFPIEYLNTLTPSGMPRHRLCLKVGAVIMLLRNLNLREGLCNGTRLRVRSLHRDFIEAEIIGGRFDGAIKLISRLNLSPADEELPVVLNRLQFPVRLAFAMTINKAQGQSFDRVGIYLPNPVFAHGQLYVALSRARSFTSISLEVHKTEKQGRLVENCDTTFTLNVVYKEVLV